MTKPDLQYKCYILLREDLNMPIGKLAAQVGHGLDQVWAAYNTFKESTENNENFTLAVPNFDAWHTEGRRKIILRLKDEEHLDKVKAKIQAEIEEREVHPGFFVHDIFDYGFNFFDGLTLTGLIIYPNKEQIKAVKRLQCW